MKYKKKRFVEIPGTKNTTYENLMIYQISKKVSYKLVMKKKEEIEWWNHGNVKSNAMYIVHSEKFRLLGTSKIMCDKKIEKQPSKGVLIKTCAENMLQIYWRTPMPKCVVLQLY